MAISSKNKKSLSIAIIGLFVFSIGILIVFLNPLADLQQQLSNALYHEQKTNYPIVVVAIDNKSVDDQVGLGKFQDWNREYYAKIIENLEKYQPASIGLDIFFRSKTKGLKEEDVSKLLFQSPNEIYENLKRYAADQIHPNDQALSHTISKFSNIVLAYNVEEDKDLKNLQTFGYFKNKYQPLYPLDILKNIQSLKRGYIKFDADNAFVNKFIPLLKDKSTTEFHFSFALQNIFNLLNFNFDPETSHLSGQKIQLQALGKSPAQLSNLKNSLEISLEKGQILVNYFQKPPLTEAQGYKSESVKTIPFVDVYKDAYISGFDPAYFKNKIVLIGVTADALNDNHLTPIDPQVKMPGVMIHANAIQTILDQKFLQNQSFISMAIVLLIFALLAILAIFFLQIRYAIPVIIVLGTAYYLSAPFFFDHGLILNLVYPQLTLILTLIVGYTYRYLTEFRQKKFLHYAFSKYVDKDVVEQTIKDHTKLNLGGERREITVLFSDIANFTTLSEQLEPAKLVTLLNQYFEAMGQIVAKNGGLLDKFEGDAIMAFFGAPNDQPDHAIRAAMAALEMRQALPVLIQKWQEDKLLVGAMVNSTTTGTNSRSDFSFDFRIGISTGEAVVGNIGSENRFSYTAIGDIVNLGSRLESANKKYGTKIMISGPTYEQIKDQVEVRLLDYIKVKGKNQPVQIFELLALKNNLTEEQKNFMNSYNKALQLYFERKFIDALKILEEETLKIYPQDTPAMIYAGRCEILKRFPPPASWDFVYTMQGK